MIKTIFKILFNKTVLRANLSSSLISTVVYLIIQIITMPVLLRYWGKDITTTWIVMTSIPAYIAMTDVGFGNSFANLLLISKEEGNFVNTGTLVRSMRKYQLFISIIILFIGGLFIWFPSTQIYLGGEKITRDTFTIAASVLLVYSILCLQSSYYMAVYRASDCNSEYNNAVTVARLSEFIVILPSVFLGGGIVGVSLALLTVRTLFMTYLEFKCIKFLKLLAQGSSSASFFVFWEIFHNGFGYFGYSLGYLISNQIIISYLMIQKGGDFVLLLCIARQPARIFLQACSIVFTSVHPEMTKAYAHRDIPRMRDLSSKTLMPVLIFGPIFCVSMIFIGPKIINIWTGGVAIGRLLVFTAAFEAVSHAFANASMIINWSTNQTKLLSIFFLASQILALLVITTVYSMQLDPFSVPLTFGFCTLIYAAIALIHASKIIKIGLFRQIICGFNLAYLIAKRIYLNNNKGSFLTE